MTDEELDEKAGRAVRLVMNGRTSEFLYRIFGYWSNDRYDDIAVDSLDLKPQLVEALKANGFDTLGEVLGDQVKNMRKMPGLCGHMEEVVYALVIYIIQEWDITRRYALRRHLPLYKILGYEDIRKFRNVSLDAFFNLCCQSIHSNVLDSVGQSGLLTLHELLTLDLDAIYDIVRRYPSSNSYEESYYERIKAVEYSPVFRFLVILDSMIKRNSDALDRARVLYDLDENPQPVTYPIDPAWQHKVRRLIEGRIAGRDVSLDGLLPSERDIYAKAACAVDDCGEDFYKEVMKNPEYCRQVAESLNLYVRSSLPDVETYAWLITLLHGIPDCIRDMKVSHLMKFYDLHREGKLDFLEDEDMDTKVYDFFSAYVKEALADLNQFAQWYVDSMDEFLLWAGSVSMPQVIKETFTRRMGESSWMYEEVREESRKVALLRASGMSRKDAGNMLGITNMKVASDEKYMYDALLTHLYSRNGYCRHDLAAAYFLLNPGETSLDKKTLDNLVGPVRSFIYWLSVQKSCDYIKNYLYKYSPEDDVIYLKNVRRKSAVTGTEPDKPKRGRPKGTKNRK
ncbi:MAG: hypothetical protein LUD51_05910 [Clostridia bacterium]|nr:hypothetical protein [Clostridia bacterium]